ncbi:MAG TPA: phosphoglucosamine mutase [Vicinamibacterales bacterium]|nr:phosphoglucosamine mutase [Vicinamibacterales bacterium]
MSQPARKRQPLFGTDGVRGVAGNHPLDIPTITRLGAAIVRTMPPEPGRRGYRPRILIGRDTRESGAWIERALSRGAAYEGGTTESAGVIPTPAIAFLTAARRYDLGVVISASHNPYEDNGIKVFCDRGGKISEAREQDIEAVVADRSWEVDETGLSDAVPRVEYTDEYVAHVRKMLPDPARLHELRIAIDCANGATSLAGPRLFHGLGLDTRVIGASPDGRNINLGCGSTHPEFLADYVVREGIDVGVAFDGDGDRAIFVAADGRVVDGDAVLLMCALHRKPLGLLPGDAVVATVMSNIGLEIALREHGIAMPRCPVGDKYVAEEMQKKGIALGGEQSGHVIFDEHLATGDGLATAMAVLRVMADTGRALASLASDLVTFPQVLVNVKVREKRPIDGDPALKAVMKGIEKRLEGEGRLLVRYSGTEPLMRIMIEGRDQSQIQAWADEIAEVVKQW